MEKSKELRRFLIEKSDTLRAILIGAFLSLMGLFFLIELILESASPWFVWIISVGCIGLGVLIFWLVLGNTRELNQWLTEHYQDIDTILDEFQHGKQFFMGRLRMGNTYIFGKGIGKIYTYNDIVHIYQRANYTKGVGSYTELVFVHKKGPHIVLCKGMSKGEHMAAMAFIKEKKPLVSTNKPIFQR